MVSLPTGWDKRHGVCDRSPGDDDIGGFRFAAIGTNVNAAHMVAAAGTNSVIPAAADEVSAGIAHLFSQHAADYQGLAAQAAAFQEQFVQNLTASAGSYANIEAALAAFLQSVQSLNVSADALVSTLATWTPQEWLTNIEFVLLLPVIIPAAIVLLLAV
jgi:hypothetical protein